MRSKPGIFWRWLKVAWPFLVGTIVLVGLSILSLDILSGARAYIEGESLWSKAQKEAVSQLNRYAHSRDEADFKAYLTEISVHLGDRKARGTRKTSSEHCHCAPGLSGRAQSP